MRFQELNELIIHQLRLSYESYTLRRKINEYVNADREGGARNLTKEQADKVVKACALETIGVSKDDIKEILDGKRDINSIVSSWLAMKRVCDYVSNLFERVPERSG